MGGCVRHRSPRMEGGVGAMATSSGQAATTLAILNISSGQHVVAASTLSGGPIRT